MADDVPAGFSLKRWSRRKLEAARSTREASTPPIAGTAPDPAPAQSLAPAMPTSTSAVPPAPSELPPVASLSFESDFSAFLQPKVEEGLKRQALKKLFSDPRFNVMDGLDTYIDDYSKPDPISAELVRQMVQSRYIFDPPQTRVNAEGFVEDVPPDEIVAPAESTSAAEAAGDSALPPALPPNASVVPAVDPASTLPAAEPVSAVQTVPPMASDADVPDLLGGGAGSERSEPKQSRSR